MKKKELDELNRYVLALSRWQKQISSIKSGTWADYLKESTRSEKLKDLLPNLKPLISKDLYNKIKKEQKNMEKLEKLIS